MGDRKFLHTIKPFLWVKIKSRESVILVKKDKLTSKLDEVANSLNDFFFNIIKISVYYKL